jgi:NTP pyrophosphatase (non-canonical NTP hydrolase)
VKAGCQVKRAYLECVAFDFAAQAEENIKKWGAQDLQTLGLAIAEETGELCQAILKREHEAAPLDRIRAEAQDLGALCLQITAKVDSMLGGAW